MSPCTRRWGRLRPCRSNPFGRLHRCMGTRWHLAGHRCGWCDAVTLF